MSIDSLQPFIIRTIIYREGGGGGIEKALLYLRFARRSANSIDWPMSHSPFADSGLDRNELIASADRAAMIHHAAGSDSLRSRI